jgi:hypothetical protein
MYTFSVSSPSNPAELQFPVRPQVVAFAGSRRGSLSESVATSLVHAFYALDLTFLTCCATGIDGCFRRVLSLRPFEQRSMVACAFERRAKRFDAVGITAYAVVPDGLSPAAALHRRTVWMVRQCGLLVLFPADPVFGRWGRGSTLAFRTAVYNLKPVFVASPTAPSSSPLYRIFPASLFGMVSGFWVVPEGGPYDEV